MKETKTSDLIPRRFFFDPLKRRLPRVSPNGEWIVFQAPIDGVFNLWLARFNNPLEAHPVTMYGDRSLGLTVAWAFDNRHVLVSRDEDGDENFCIFSVDIHTRETRSLSPARGVKAYIQQLSRKLPKEVLIAHNERSKQHFDLYRISLETDTSKIVEKNYMFQGFVTDSNFEVRLARRYTGLGEVEYLRRSEEGTWTRYTLIPFEDSLSTRPVAYSSNGKRLFWLDSRGRDKSAVVSEDVETRDVRVLAEDSQADISSIVLDAQSRHPVAAASVYSRTKWVSIDPQFSPVFDDLIKQFPGDIKFISMSDDANRFILLHVQDTEPAEFILYDRRTAMINRLFSVQPNLENQTLVRMQPVVIRARDNLDLVCYLSRPGEQSLPPPMVVVVHGGPWLRDIWGLNPTHQWLANRGYAVLSVNFRGSSGFGKAFINAANKEWGGKMQWDLVDAVDWAISEGVADPDRIAIMGGSYGGFAALTGLTLTPHKFCCAVDLVGISNLSTFLDTVPEYWRTWKSVYKTRLGNFTTEEGRRFLQQRSPLSHVDRIEKPLLIVQGANDVRVKAAESEQIVAAMQERGIPVTYVLYPDEGHGIQRMENQRSYHAVVEAFLAQHLYGPCEPTADDLAGSSLRFMAGQALIAGL